MIRENETFISAGSVIFSFVKRARDSLYDHLISYQLRKLEISTIKSLVIDELQACKYNPEVLIYELTILCKSTDVS